MRFLADESCDFCVVRALRNAGHDVASVAEVTKGAKDAAVIALAGEEERVLLTEDKDFGWLVFAAGHGGIGVVLFRFPAKARRLQEAAAVEAVSRFPGRLPSSFTVVEPGRVRIRASLPTGGD
jgi:predicted nuclease of predicted toxin-antitoxin system